MLLLASFVDNRLKVCPGILRVKWPGRQKSLRRRHIHNRELGTLDAAAFDQIRCDSGLSPLDVRFRLDDGTGYSINPSHTDDLWRVFGACFPSVYGPEHIQRCS